MLMSRCVAWSGTTRCKGLCVSSLNSAVGSGGAGLAGDGTGTTHPQMLTEPVVCLLSAARGAAARPQGDVAPPESVIGLRCSGKGCAVPGEGLRGARTGGGGPGPGVGVHCPSGGSQAMLSTLLGMYAAGRLGFPGEGLRLEGRWDSASRGGRAGLRGALHLAPLGSQKALIWGFSVSFLGPISFVCITDSQGG